MATTLAIGSGSGSTERHLSREEVRQLVEDSVHDLHVRGKRVLTIIPDGTRTMPMPLMFELLQSAMAEKRAAASNYIVALGTHRAMDEAQLSAHFGQPVHEGVCGSAKVMNHRWDVPETFIELGTISADEVERLSGGLLREE